jgi:hypothetical protein
LEISIVGAATPDVVSLTRSPKQEYLMMDLTGCCPDWWLAWHQFSVFVAGRIKRLAQDATHRLEWVIDCVRNPTDSRDDTDR